MGVNSRLSKAAGVRQSAVLMGSQANKALLADIGIRARAIDEASANDLVIAVVADDAQAVDVALKGVDAALLAVETGTTRSEVHTLEDGLRRQPGANLAVLTIPGEYVYPEARQALEAGLHLFIFSSNVPLDQERELKRLAADRGLLVMGPDCGTSIVGGVGIGFANAVRRGAIGVIGPAGTGLQEFTCQVHHAGGGISHAIGTGSHDLSNDIGGATTLAALEALERDPSTKVIAIVAKPGGERTREVLISRLEACGKPVVACLLGVHVRSAAGRADRTGHLRRLGRDAGGAQWDAGRGGGALRRITPSGGRSHGRNDLPSAPVWVVENKAFGNWAFCRQVEGSQQFGDYSAERWTGFDSGGTCGRPPCGRRCRRLGGWT